MPSAATSRVLPLTTTPNDVAGRPADPLAAILSALRAAIGESPARLAYSPETAAKAVGLDSETLLRAARRGELRAVRVGRRVLFRPADLDAWLIGQTRGAAAAETVAIDTREQRSEQRA